MICSSLGEVAGTMTLADTADRLALLLSSWYDLVSLAAVLAQLDLPPLRRLGSRAYVHNEESAGRLAHTMMRLSSTCDHITTVVTSGSHPTGLLLAADRKANTTANVFHIRSAVDTVPTAPRAKTALKATAGNRVCQPTIIGNGK